MAHAIAARSRGGDAPKYGGGGVCYLEFGDEQVATVEVDFRPGETPHGVMLGPSAALVADKQRFGTSRILRWFGRDWQPVG